MSNPKVSLCGRNITRIHLIRSRLLLRLSWTPLTVPLTFSSTLSWRIWVMVRSTIHNPNLARMIPNKNTETEQYSEINSDKVILSYSSIISWVWFPTSEWSKKKKHQEWFFQNSNVAFTGILMKSQIQWRTRQKHWKNS